MTNLRRLIRALAVAAILALSAAPAWAGCTMTISSLANPVSWLGGGGTGYDVFDATDHIQTVAVSVKKTAGSGCSYFIAATAGGSGSFNSRKMISGANSLTYNLYTSAAKTNILEDLPGATSSQVISGTFTSTNTTQNKNLYFDIPVQQIGKPGTYIDTLSVKLYSGTVSSNTLVQTVTGQKFQASVVAVAQMSLVPTGQAFNQASTTQSLNFGTLSAGQALGFDMRARGNNGYGVTMQSANSGVMTSAGTTDTVPYTLSVGGSNVNLSGGIAVTVASATTPSTVNGNLSAVLATIGAIAGISSGSYSDTITVVITSN